MATTKPQCVKDMLHYINGYQYALYKYSPQKPQCLKELTLGAVQGRQEVVSACVEALMLGIEANVSNKNRDRFV